MCNVTIQRQSHKNEFEVIAEPFVHGEGLPFAEVLDAETIRRAFREEDALFAQHPDDIFSTEIALWAFLAQSLRDGKGAACSAAVSDIATYMLQTGQQPPSGDTGDYCRARAKLNLAALRGLVTESSRHLEGEVEESWLWKGRHAKLVDGFTFTMPDTPDNQAAFPQNPSQEPGVGLPIARACTVLSLASACVCDLAIGPYAGKETGESALLRDLLDAFDEGDVAVFDRYYCSFMMLALFSLRGVQVCARLHQRRISDPLRGGQLGRGDRLVTWTRPQRPAWMSPAQYDHIPEALTLRELQFDVHEPGRRVERLTVITTLTDAKAYTKARHRRIVRLSVERGAGHPGDQADPGPGSSALQDAGDGSARVVGNLVGIQSHPQGDCHRCGHPPQAAAWPGLYLGLPDHPGVLDAVVHEVRLQRPRYAEDDAVTHRRQ